MSPNDDEPIGDYVLEEMGTHERRDLDRRMAVDPALRERVEGLEEIAGLLAALPREAWETLEVDPRARARGRTRSARPRPLLRRGLAAAACALLLAIGVGIGVLIERPTAAGGPTVELRALGGAPSPDRAIARMAGGGRMVLSVEHLPRTAPGRYYELWLMNSASDLVAVASFSVGAGGRAELNVPLPVAAGRYRYLDISLQQASAGPAHSGDSVLRAPIGA